MSRLASLTLATVLLAAAAIPALADSYTTRIETRPFYGATVTLEEGVRVFRPLPPTRHMIINPQGSTPLNLWQNDVRISEERNINVYNHGGENAAPVYSSSGTYPTRNTRDGDHGKTHRAPGGVRAGVAR